MAICFLLRVEYPFVFSRVCGVCSGGCGTAVTDECVKQVAAITTCPVRRLFMCCADLCPWSRGRSLILVLAAADVGPKPPPRCSRRWHRRLLTAVMPSTLACPMRRFPNECCADMCVVCMVALGVCSGHIGRARPLVCSDAGRRCSELPAVMPISPSAPSLVFVIFAGVIRFGMLHYQHTMN